jgi:5'-nucleotidase (lipoprotein e(P4) family)
MKTLIIVTSLIMLTACGTVRKAAAPASESQDQLILATLWYQRSAEMRALYYQCYRNAGMALAGNMARSDKTKPVAVVMDIDETVLDNSPFEGWQVLEGRAFNDQEWERWVKLSEAEALPGAVAFTQYADSLGVEVFYVSNRTFSEAYPTLANLNEKGFADADMSHLLLKENTSSKIPRREMIEKDYEILLLRGDNLADMSGRYDNRGSDLGFVAVDAEKDLFGTRYIILPNPMYGTWLNELMKRSGEGTDREKLLRMLKTF